MTAKSKIGNPKKAAGLNDHNSSTKRSQGSGVEELAIAYRIARGAPASRMPAIRIVLHSYLDTCKAIVDDMPTKEHCAIIENYLSRLFELRACSLAKDDWKLDVLDWLRSKSSVIQHLTRKKIR